MSDIETIEKEGQTLVVIREVSDLHKITSVIENPDYQFMAYDTETTGLGHDALVIGYSVSPDANSGYYVITREWDKEKQELITLPTNDHTKLVISKLLKKDLIMHNALFDIRVTNYNYGIDLTPALHTDTMFLAKMTDENASAGLKDLGKDLFGESAKAEKIAMDASILAAGGRVGKKQYDLYKGDSALIGLYGAKDTMLTMAVFYSLADDLINQGLDTFFYDDETMPFLRTVLTDLNFTGIKVDPVRMQEVEQELTNQIFKLKSELLDLVTPLVKDKYPGTTKKNIFNPNSSAQLAWLLFGVKGELFENLTDGGREMARDLIGRVPYKDTDKRTFITACLQSNLNPYKYMKTDADTLEVFENRHRFVKVLMEMRKAEKLLGTYVLGIKTRMVNGYIYPTFSGAKTKTGRLSSSDPNFQNLPKNDKRVKSMMISRNGKSFVGADYSQLEPRIFADIAKEPVLMHAFANRQDVYSSFAKVLFDIDEGSLDKESPDFFGIKYEVERDAAKAALLALAYGNTPNRLMKMIKGADGNYISKQRAQQIRDYYFEKYPTIALLMETQHNLAKAQGYVENIYGRRRRIPLAKKIPVLFPNVDFVNLDYEWRSHLNQAMNFLVQGSAGSIANRAMVACKAKAKAAGIEMRFVMQVHDEIILECADKDAPAMALILKDAMENTSSLPNGTKLEAKPVIAKRLSDLK